MCSVSHASQSACLSGLIMRPVSCARGQSAAPGSPSHLREDLWLPSELVRPPNAPLPTGPFHEVPNPHSLAISVPLIRIIAAGCFISNTPTMLTVVRSEALPKTDVTQHPLRLYAIVRQRKQQKKKCFVPPSNLWTLHIFVSPQMSYLRGLFWVLVTY